MHLASKHLEPFPQVVWDGTLLSLKSLRKRSLQRSVELRFIAARIDWRLHDTLVLPDLTASDTRL